MLSEKFIEELRKKIRKSKEYSTLEKRRSELLLSFRFVEANHLTKAMREIEDKSIKTYIDNLESESKSVRELTDSMTEEDRDTMNIYGNMLVMLCDLMESTSINMNSLLKKYHPTYRVTTFDQVVELGKEARERVRMLDSYSSDTYYTNTYGTTADKLYEMVFNKVKSFISKIKSREERSKNKKVA